MGLFVNRPEEQQNHWAGLPSEPLDADEAEIQETVRTADSLTLGLGLGLGNPVTSIVFPVTPPSPEAADVASADGD